MDQGDYEHVGMMPFVRYDCNKHINFIVRALHNYIQIMLHILSLLCCAQVL